MKNPLPNLILFLLLAVLQGQALAESYELSASQSPVNILGDLYVAKFEVPEDPEDTNNLEFLDQSLRPSFEYQILGLGVNDAPDVRWEKVSGSEKYLHAIDSPTWMAIEFKNSSDAEVSYMLDKFGLGLVTWHTIDNSGVVKSHYDTMDKPRAGRNFNDTGSIIPIRLKPGEAIQVYFGLFVFSEPLWEFLLWEEGDFRDDRLEDMILDGLYFGLLLTLVLFCFVVYANIKEPVYLFFGLFLFSCGSTVFFGASLHNQFFFEHYFRDSFSFIFISSGLVDFFAAIFSILLLRIHQTNRLLFRAWLGMIAVNWINVIFGIYVTTGYFEGSAALFFSALTAAGLEILLYLWTLVSAWRSSPLTRYWFIVIFIHSVMFIFWSASTGNPSLIEVDPKRLIQVVTMFDALLICGVLAYMYRLERDERLFAQELSVENLRLARDIEQARANFVSTVSHDLHGPVRAISFFAESLRSETTDRGRLGVQRIEENVETVETLLDSLVRFSESDSRAQFSIETVDLSHILYTLKNEFDPLARLKTVQLLIPNSTLQLETDPVALSQVLRNLLDNALKYTSSGVVRISLEEQPDHIVIEVSDTGRGIAESQLEKVFEEFYQVSKRDSEGVGLGLSIVARLTKLMGIELHVKSTEGVGSEFSLIVPKSFPKNLLPSQTGPAAGEMLDLVVGVVGLESPGLQQALAQLRGWGLTLTSEPTDFSDVDFLVAELADRDSSLLAQYPNKPLFLFGEEKGFTPPSERAVILALDVEPMKMRAALQRLMSSESS